MNTDSPLTRIIRRSIRHSTMFLMAISFLALASEKSVHGTGTEDLREQERQTLGDAGALISGLDGDIIFADKMFIQYPEGPQH